MRFGSLDQENNKAHSRRGRRVPVFGITMLALVTIWLLMTGETTMPGGAALAAGHDESPKTIAGATRPEGTKPVIELNWNKSLGKLPSDAFGVWLGNSGHDRPDPMYLYRTPEGKAKFAEIGARNLFYAADADNWAAPFDTFTAVPRAYPEWMDTDEYLSLNAELGSAPVLAVNVTVTCKQADVNLPPSGDNVSCKKVKASESVAWMSYLKSKNAPVKNVVLGAEPYAGCLYWTKGINCTDKAGHHRVALTQDEYAARVVKWARKMKKANPGIRIGANIRPNTYLCKNTSTIAGRALDTDEIDLSSAAAAAACGGKSWDQTVMQVAGNSIDFFVVHQYFVIRHHAANEADAQRLSYYQEQINVRVQKQGVTAFPSQIRKELNQWLPSKVDAPIMVSEFNTSYIDNVPDEEKYLARQSLYTGLATGALFLDLLKPVKTPHGLRPGAANAILLGMFAPQLTLTRLTVAHDPASMVYMPTWHVMAMLKTIPGKMLVKTKVKNNPKTAVNRGALNVTAVKNGKNVSIVVFNNHTAPVTADIAFNGVSPVSVTGTRLGHNATGFLGMNDSNNPNAITPEAVTIPPSKIKAGKLQAIQFPAHSMTVLEIVGK